MVALHQSHYVSAVEDLHEGNFTHNSAPVAVQGVTEKAGLNRDREFKLDPNFCFPNHEFFSRKWSQR